MKTTLEITADRIDAAFHWNLRELVERMTCELSINADQTRTVCEYLDVFVDRASESDLKAYAHAANYLLHAMDDWLLVAKLTRSR